MDEAVKELGNKVTGIRSDAGDIAATDNLVEQVRSLYGRVDILFVNAGVALQEFVGQLTEQTFDEIMNVNFKGAVFTTEKFLPILSDGGAILYITSVSAFAVAKSTSVYAASKAALTAYSKTAAIELAERKIRVNTIAPAMTETRAIYKGQFESRELHDFIRSKVPFKRYGQPEEVAKLAAFLASDDAVFITGDQYVIDGGATVNEPFRS